MLASFGVDVQHLVYFFIGNIAAFTICIVMFGGRTAAVQSWLMSNVLGIAGMVSLAYTGTNIALMAEVGAALTVISGALKAVAFGGGRIALKRFRLANAILLLSFICGALVLILPSLQYIRMFFLLGMAFSLVASLVYLRGNKQWFGLREAAYATIMLLLGLGGVLAVITQAFPLGAETRLVSSAAEGVANFARLCVASMAIELVFLTLTLARNRREKERAFRRTVHLKDNLVLKERLLQQTVALSDEQQNLIKMLTHEVRQPLNTAQAVLQSLAADVAAIGSTSPSAGLKLNNALTVLNTIAASISNSLLGATLISNNRKAELKSVDVCDVSQLAYLDINLSSQTRIDVQFEQPHIYVDADPIVLRLALRNLLENAVKYSPADTRIVFKVKADEDQLSIQFSVTNNIIDLAMLDGDLFARNKRGADSRYGGDGLGLFIVNEVAKMHEGSLRYDIARNDVTFQLEIPA
ncbi:sensor histidine kinase [Sphingorhabdus sp.]|uniref:sensor histidine kinase n=1 Tax=Sphingorhabdus sp. TaxID=1902408 RepID=UPI003340040C